MNGNEMLTIKGKGISFSNFYNNPIIDVEDLIIVKDISWNIEIGFKLGAQTPKKDELIIYINVNLLRASDEAIISTLELECKHDISSDYKLPQLHKFNLLNILMNSAIGQLQGGWVAKHTNASLKLLIPQIMINDETTSEDLKKKIQEKWE